MAVLMLIVGLVVGGLLVAYVFMVVMRNKMVVAHRAEGSFAEVCSRLEETLKDANGWGQPIPAWEFYESQISKGLRYENIRACKIFFVCKPPYANEVVRDEARWAGIMPCSWAIYETMDGQVYIAKMNIPLMALMMTGVVGRVMKRVAREEGELLEKVAKASAARQTVAAAERAGG